jgi:PAS domain S-box-containing protein
MAENRTILIVDHEPRAAMDTGRVLRSAGYEVLEAPSGKECLSLAREKRPQLILIAEALPDISGIDLAKQIKGDAELSRAYVAVLSRDGTAPAIQARALENGADALILRTSQTRELLARVEALLRRQMSEETLRTSMQDYRATFDAISDAVYLVNMEYTVTDCNLAMARFLARPRGEIVGGRCFELVHGTAKPIPACLGHRVRETRRRETLVVPMEERWLQVDVDPLMDASGAVIGSVHVLRDITEQRRTEDALQQAQAELDLRAAEHHLALDKANKDLQAELEARVHTQDVLKGSQADLERRDRELQEATQARRSAEENLQRAQQDLRTAAAERRAQQEKEVVTAQLHQTQKMDALRRLAAVVASEFNRLLAMIVGQVELLLARIGPSNPLYADLQAIARVARQGVALIRQLLAFAGREAVQPEVLDVNAAIQKLKPRLRRALGQGIELRLALAPQLKPVYADAHVLQEIWLSLAARAATAMPHGGVLRMDTAGVTLTAADARLRPLARVGDYVRVTLGHSGAVLPEEALQGIFELQLTSPETEVGSELGLGVVYGLVRQLGGFMEVAQTAAGETAWEVYLPAHPAEGAVEPETAAAEEQGRAAAPELVSASAPQASASHEPPAAPEPAPPEPVSAAAGEPETTSAAAEAVPSPPVAETSAPDVSPQATPGASEPSCAPAAEPPAVQETGETAPTASASAASEPVARLPAWLVEQPAHDDITTAPSEPTDTSTNPPADITETEPPPSPPSGVSGLRSRLRRLGRKGGG